jgi:predicted nucleotidyltransferase
MVNIYKLGLTQLQQDILCALFKKVGLSLNQRQLAKALNVSAPAVSKALPRLEKLNYILRKKDKETKRHSIELNRGNHYLMQLKRVDNLKNIYTSGLATFLEKEYAGATIILFGSYSRGEDLFNSDIDIAIIGRKEKNIELEKFEKELEKKLHLLFFESLKKTDKNLRNNILNGIVLVGSVEI